MDSMCISCQTSTKYRCIKCNMTLDCSVPVSEDFPRWKMCQQTSLCKECDLNTFKNTESEGKSDEERLEVSIVKVCKSKEKIENEVEPEGEFLKKREFMLINIDKQK